VEDSTPPTPGPNTDDPSMRAQTLSFSNAVKAQGATQAQEVFRQHTKWTCYCCSSSYSWTPYGSARAKSPSFRADADS
jgi:hypothetical protein